MATSQTKPAPAKQGRGLHEFLSRTLERHWRNYRKARKRCHKKVSEDAVHQWRIDTRRMLAVLSVIEPLLSDKCFCKAQTLLGKQLKRSGRLRDTHVQLVEIERQLRRFPELAPFHTALACRKKRLTRRLRQAGAAKTDAELKQTLGKLRQRLGPLFRDSASEPAHWQAIMRSVDEAFHHVVRLRAQARASRPATIHATRVAFKRFRYMAEALGPVLPGGSQAQLRQMQAYQKLMGDIQDLEVLLAALNQITRKKRLRMAAFRDTLEQRHTAAILRFMESAGNLGAFWPFRRSPRAPGTKPLDHPHDETLLPAPRAGGGEGPPQLPG